jgi:hypothetical protein
MKFASIALILPFALLSGTAFAAEDPPMDPLIINFQGRIEVNDVGYSGTSWFAFTIGNEGITESYWHGKAQTTCMSGIYNILLGKDTDEALTSDIFNQNTDLYMRVAFTNVTAGDSGWEQLTPDQQITGVAFAVNADLLDGLESPDSDLVGISDEQILTNKVLGAGTYTTYFLIQPSAAPAGDQDGYLWFDSAANALKVRADGQWVVLTGGGGSSGGWINGTGANNYVTYWTGETTLSGEMDFTYDRATDKLSLMNNGTAGAFWITQSGALVTTGVDEDEGGALHVYNQGSTGSAITAYSSQTATSSLVWFRASYQPVLRLEGNSGWANPFWLVPQQHWAGANGYAVQTGEMYMGVDGTLNYYRGDGWERMVGRWTMETCTRTGNDTLTVSAQRNFNPGRPLRYRDQDYGDWLYGIVADYSGGTVTVGGAPLPAIAEIEVGKPELIRQMNFFESDKPLISDDYMAPNAWEMQDGYIVRATAKMNNADDTDPYHIGFGIGQTDTDLLTGDGYLILPGGSTARVASDINISTTNYVLGFGDKVYVKVLAIGDIGTGLSVTLDVVTP